MSPSNRQAGKGNTSQRKPAPRSPKTTMTKQEQEKVAIPRETLVRRVIDARRAGMVVLAARAIGGGLITLLLTSAAYWLAIPILFGLKSVMVITPLSVFTAVGLVIAARFASLRSMPEEASRLPFLTEKAFLWVDPFRDDRPNFLPLWVDAILWAPTQVLAGAVPFQQVQQTHQAEAEAASDVARRMVEEGEIDLTDGVDPGSSETKGLRLLLLLRLAKLVVDDGTLKGRVSGLGQTALFEGTVG